MRIDGLAPKSLSRAERKKLRRQRLMDQREQVCGIYFAILAVLVEGPHPWSQGDAFVGWADLHLQERVQAESAMEEAFECLDIQETSSRDVSKPNWTELDYKLAAAPIQQKQKIFNPCSKEGNPPASSTLQLNRYFGNPFREMVGWAANDLQGFWVSWASSPRPPYSPQQRHWSGNDGLGLSTESIGCQGLH